MAKETKKKFKLPAQGKPKPKVKKTSARDLGKTANEQFKKGSEEKNLKAIFDRKSNKYLTAKESAKVLKDSQKGMTARDKRIKETSGVAKTRNMYARITGV